MVCSSSEYLAFPSTQASGGVEAIHPQGFPDWWGLGLGLAPLPLRQLEGLGLVVSAPAAGGGALK